MSTSSAKRSGRPRVLITRTRHQASSLAAAVERMGAEAILIPMIEIASPVSFGELDDAIRKLDGSEEAPDWVIFTSANAAIALVDRAAKLQAKVTLQRIAVIGPATAKAVHGAGLEPVMEPVLVPEEYIAESLASSLLMSCKSSQRFLLVRAEEARDEIPLQLRAAGHFVQIASAYRNVTPQETLATLQAVFAAPELYPHMITFTSSSTARNLVTLLGSVNRTIPEGIALASIGPITSATLRELGYEPTFEADEPTIDSLAAAIESYLERS